MSVSKPTEKFIETKNGRIYYYCSANAESKKPTVVFLHGLSANHTTWLKLMGRLAELGYNSIAPDLRGHGHSDKARDKSLYNFDKFANDLNDILEQERIDQVILVGYSFGGPIAINFNVKYPKKVFANILLSANHKSPFNYWRVRFLQPVASGFLGLSAFLLRWQKRQKYPYLSQDNLHSYWHATFAGLTTMPISVNLMMLRQVVDLDLDMEVAKISAPTLIIRAKGDPILTVEECHDLTRKIPHSELITTKHESHFLAVSAQDEISKIILDFLQKLNLNKR